MTPSIEVSSPPTIPTTKGWLGVECPLNMTATNKERQAVTKMRGACTKDIQRHYHVHRSVNTALIQISTHTHMFKLNKDYKTEQNKSLCILW